MEQHDRSNHAPQDIEDIENERPHQESRHQNRSDQCQQRSIFECHGRSMNVAHVIRNQNAPAENAIMRRNGTLAMKSRQGYKGYVIEATIIRTEGRRILGGVFRRGSRCFRRDRNSVLFTRPFPTQESAIEAAIQAGRQKIDVDYDWGRAVVNG